MLDIDDPSQIALSDRQGWLTRAARAQERWAEAIANGQQAAISLPHVDPAAVIWLALPTALIGIGLAVQSIYAQTSASRVFLWQTSMAALPVEGVWLDPYGVMERNQPRRLSLPAAPMPQSHPSTIFLFLLSTLDGWLGGHLAADAIEWPADRFAALASSAAEIARTENPAKQMAYRLHERLPLFWAEEPLIGAAYDWWQRYSLYAEAKAEWSRAEAIRQVTAAVRFPRYWPQAGSFVRLAQRPEDGPSWLGALDRLFQRRKLQGMTVTAQIVSLPAALLYLFEMGEWIALYAAALLGVDPAERVALDFLDALDRPNSSTASSTT